MIRKQEATGKTVDEARAKACALLGVQADDLNVSCEVLEMPQKTGFLGLKLTPAKVCVSVEEPDAPAAAPAEPVVEKKTPVQEAVKAAPVAEEPAAVRHRGHPHPRLRQRAAADGVAHRPVQSAGPLGLRPRTGKGPLEKSGPASLGLGFVFHQTRKISGKPLRRCSLEER